MATQIELGGIVLDVVKKDIKNVHLSVYPPAGRVRLAAPARMQLDTIRLFAISKLGWIRQQQKKLREQERETEREYIERESHYVWGTRCLLSVVERDAAPSVQLRRARLTLFVRPGADAARRKEILEAWYRERLRAEAEALAAHWQPQIGVRMKALFVQRMRTRWGSCNPAAGTIRLNADLAKKPGECLEYIVVHELVHMLEPTHNARFVALMDRFLPGWPHRRELLNRLPVRHEDWSY
ncbi:MAG: M48 family metallopeptidase [Burkholderiales bacterium]|nr:M48 family metallopeptidase [Burkholderiales bacterium]